MASSDAPSFNDILAAILEDILIPFSFESLAYGAAAVLCIMAIIKIWRRGLDSFPRRFLLIALLIMLISSTVFHGVSFAWYFNDVKLGPTNDNLDALYKMEVLWNPMVVFSRINYAMSDVIVFWRAWVLSDNLILRAITGTSIVGTIVCTIVDATLTCRDGLLSNNGTRDRLVLFIPLLTTNIICTLVIIYKTWIYRLEIKSQLSSKSEKRPVERVLVLLIESGLVYCALWLLVLFSNIIPKFPIRAFYVIDAMFPHISAIYPTIIILLVSQQNVESEEVVSSFSGFRARPGRQSRSIIQSMAEHIQTTFDESDSQTQSPVSQNSIQEKGFAV